MSLLPALLRPLWTATLSTALLLCSTAASAALPASVTQSLRSFQLPDSALSVALIPLQGGQPAMLNADAPVNPASTMKLVTTYAALELLEPTFQWHTTLLTDGRIQGNALNGNLYFRAGGDPVLNMERLWLLLRELRSSGVQQINGDLVLDNGYFRMPPPQAFNDDGQDPDQPFLVTPDPLLVNFKSVRVIARNEGSGPQVSVEPPNAYLRIDNQLRSGGSSCDNTHISQQAQATGEAVLQISGSLASGCNNQQYMGVLEHPTYAAGVLRALWSELGGRISGGNRIGNTPAQARQLAESLSPDLVSVIRDINKFSNNTMARQLFLTIGAETRRPGEQDDAASASRSIREWMASKGLRSSSLQLENGSGLSRHERISARELAQLLQAAWRSPYAAEFIASLPLPAMDGTLRKRMKNTPVAGNAHLKTGTLNNVRALAGFTRDLHGNDWVMVAIINHPRASGASAVLDQLAQALYQDPAGVSSALQQP